LNKHICARTRVYGHRHQPSHLADQELALMRVETPRVWGVSCPHALRRCPP
jgi:hypothetical protein